MKLIALTTRHAGSCGTGSGPAGAGVMFAIVLSLVGCAAKTPAWQSTTMQTGIAFNDPQAWATISKIIGKQGVYANEVYTITIPRDDLTVSAEIGDVPTAAGIETTLYFFKCPCGRLSVTGRFVVADYEANDVIASLQEGGHINIASLSPMLLRDRPHLLVVQYQGEGETEDLAKIIRKALDYTAEARMAPVKPADQ